MRETLIYFYSMCPLMFWDNRRSNRSHTMQKDEMNYRMFLGKRSVMLNRVMTIEGKDYFLAGLVELEEGVRLMVLSSHDTELKRRMALMMQEMKLPKTHREEMMLFRGFKKEYLDFDPIEITLSEKKLIISGSNYHYNEPSNPMFYGVLQFLLNNGMESAWLDQCDVQSLMIQEMFIENSDRINLTEIDGMGALTLTMRDEHIQVPVNKKVALPFGVYEQPIVLTIPDTDTHKECWINSLELFDFRVNHQAAMSREHYSDMTDTDYEKMYINLKESYESICPDGMKLAYLSYEYDSDNPLDFYPSEWLDGEPDHHAKQIGSVGLIMSNSGAEGIKGLPLKTCVLKPINPEAKDHIVVELLERTEIYKGKTYESPSLRK